jgi:hypothetical protein
MEKVNLEKVEQQQRLCLSSMTKVETAIPTIPTIATNLIFNALYALQN